MANRDRSAIHIELVHGDAETVATVNYLDSESLVEFPEIDVFHFQSLSPQQFRYGKHRADAHFIGFATCDLEAAENQLIRDTEFVGPQARHEEGGGSTVGKLGRISCRYRTLTAVGIKVGLEREQSFQ